MRERRGFVMVVVLWILAILTVATLGFGKRAYLDARAARYALDETQARMLARAAAYRGIVEIQNKFYKDRLLQTEKGNEHLGTHFGQPWARAKDLKSEGLFNPEEVGANDKVQYRIIDLDGLININNAPKPVLEEIDILDRGLMRRIWKRRTEEVHDGEGVTSFQTPEELRYLRGVDDEVWYGDDDDPGIRDIITVHGSPLININTAPRAVLESVPELGEDDAAIDQIIAFRGEAPTRGKQDGETAKQQGFADMADVRKNTDIEGDAALAINRYCTFTSSAFMILGTATRQGGKVRAQVQVVVSAIAGPGGETIGARIVDWQERSIGA